MSEIHSFTSRSLLLEESKLQSFFIDTMDALIIGEIAKSFGLLRALPIAIEVRIGNWSIYHASLPGSTVENQNWIDRKARVVMLKKHSTMFERVSAHERGVDCSSLLGRLEHTHLALGLQVRLALAQRHLTRLDRLRAEQLARVRGQAA